MDPNTNTPLLESSQKRLMYADIIVFISFKKEMQGFLWKIFCMILVYPYCMKTIASVSDYVKQLHK